MALLDEIRAILRVSAREVEVDGEKTLTSSMDGEISLLIDAAIDDLVDKGVDPEFVGDGSGEPLVKRCIALFCKANFGYDNDEAERFDESYDKAVCSLLNSRHNVAAVEAVEP